MLIELGIEDRKVAYKSHSAKVSPAVVVTSI